MPLRTIINTANIVSRPSVGTALEDSITAETSTTSMTTMESVRARVP